MNKICVIAIVGPTASGKTSYSIDLAKNIGGEIVSADSRLMYKDMNIGTAKPTKEEMLDIPHHMIDIVTPDFDYSAALYKEQAQKIICDIASRGKVPIVVGGTGLYVDILLKNFSLPQIEPDYKYRNYLMNKSFDELYTILSDVDPKAAIEINKNDKKKIIRAIEIVKTTGKTLEQVRGIGESPYLVEWIGRNFDRKTLYTRIEKRVDSMISDGLVEETKNLIVKYGRIRNIIDTIGYREISMFLDGKCTLDEAAELLKKNTRHYAKRQLTWFRKNPEIKWNVYPETLKK